MTVTGELPLPMLWEAVLVPYAVGVPYSKITVVAAPFGVTVAPRVAALVVTPEKDTELTEGLAKVEAAPVVKRDSKGANMDKPFESVAELAMRTV